MGAAHPTRGRRNEMLEIMEDLQKLTIAYEEEIAQAISEPERYYDVAIHIAYKERRLTRLCQEIAILEEKAREILAEYEF